VRAGAEQRPPARAAHRGVPDDRAGAADWLAAHGVQQVVMEATGVYWKAPWAILEDEFECLLVNARHVKQVPGRKTDV
jgi:transposase